MTAGGPDPLVTRVELSGNSAAPYIARRIVVALVDRGPKVRCLDSVLLASELVTAACKSCELVTLAFEQVPRSIKIQVECPSAPPVDEMSTALLDRLADRWDGGPPPWFEIDLVRRTDLGEMTEEELWEIVATDKTARQEIFSRYENLAGAVSRPFRRIGERSDVEQVAHMALVGAIDRFDVTRGVKFSTFAAKTVSGELKRFARDTAWAIKVPRGLKEAALRVSKEREQLNQRLGHPPTTEEIAASLDIPESEVDEALAAGDAYGISSLDAPLGDESDGSLGDTVGSIDERLATAEDWWAVEPALENLTERDQQVLHLRFFEDLSQSEIAEIIGVSQMQVSRILSSIVTRLQGELGR